jgi:hypothetical protein
MYLYPEDYEEKDPRQAHEQKEWELAIENFQKEQDEESTYE